MYDLLKISYNKTVSKLYSVKKKYQIIHALKEIFFTLTFSMSMEKISNVLVKILT